MARDSTYNVADYGAMIFDKARMSAYAHALKGSLKPGSTVIDLGTGTGIFALLACRLGARRVYAIEPDAVIEVAREIAAANGCADQIVFIQAASTKVTLSERADVIISDLSGALPCYRQHIPSIIDARRRMLAPGGVMIPRRDVAWAAVIDVPQLYQRRTGPWDTWNQPELALNMEAARRIATNTTTEVVLAQDNLVTELQRWGPIDYAVVDDPDVHGRLTWTLTRRGTGHGIAVGFDRVLADGICISNAPDAAEAIRPVVYPTIFFPWSSPVRLEPDDVVVVDLEARLVRREYIWRWKTQVLSRGASPTSKASFTQSTFFGSALSTVTLRSSRGDYEPILNEQGRITRRVLESIDDGVSLKEIAGRLSAEFSSQFTTANDALDYAVEVAVKYGEPNLQRRGGRVPRH